MIKFFYNNNSTSTSCALAWFERYKIEFEKKHISSISRDELIKLLALSEIGFKEVVKRSKKCTIKTQEEVKYIDTLTFNEAVEFLLAHKNLFQTPLIFGDKNYMAGYNEVEIRKFLPREYRFRKTREFK